MDGLDFAATIGTSTPSGTLRIGRYDSTAGFEGRVYSFRLFATADGASVIDAYPTLIGGIPCLFDTVGCKAYGAAAGTITAGPVAAGIVDTFCDPAITVPGVDMTQRTGLGTSRASAPTMSRRATSPSTRMAIRRRRRPTSTRSPYR